MVPDIHVCGFIVDGKYGSHSCKVLSDQQREYFAVFRLPQNDSHALLSTPYGGLHSSYCTCSQPIITVNLGLNHFPGPSTSCLTRPRRPWTYIR